MDELRDIGSFECVATSGINQKHYEGLSTDVDKILAVNDLGAGSSISCVDNGDYYKFHAKSKTWYKQE